MNNKIIQIYLLLIFVVFLVLNMSRFKNERTARIKSKDYFRLSVDDSIYYSKYEVTNGEYRGFLEFIKENEPEKYNAHSVKSQYWINAFSYGDMTPLMRSYYSHLAYNDYPVVNITLESAKAYCKWLSDSNEGMFFRLPTLIESQNLIKSVNTEYNSDNSVDYEVFNCNLKYIDTGQYNYPVDGCMATCVSNKSLDSYFYQNRNQMRKFNDNFIQNVNGAKHIIGNVYELLENGNYTGGSWDSLPSEVDLEIELTGPDPRVGFRLVMLKS